MSTSLLDEILKGEEVLAKGRRAPCLRAPHSAALSHAHLLRSLVTGRSLPQALPCTLLHEGRHLAMLDPTARQPELPVRAHRPRLSTADMPRRACALLTALVADFPAYRSSRRVRSSSCRFGC